VVDPGREEIFALARISCCIALRDEPRLRVEFKNALEQGIKLSMLREAVLQTYLFAGYAVAINAFITLNETAGENSRFLRENDVSPEAWKQRGEDLCRRIYGSQYEKLVHNMKGLHPDLADWMIEEGYGKVLGRPFLSPVVRELLIVVMTAAIQTERQFYSHVRGALNVGADPNLLRSVLDQLKPFIAEDVFRHYQLILDALLQQ
jgi:alkylhydroperoxidase/carboxymuconolactone decarboxylase family protein YurZ